MKTILLATFVIILLAPGVARAGPSGEPQRDLVVSRQHGYWLSDRLNRLVFWKAPSERDQMRRQ